MLAPARHCRHNRALSVVALLEACRPRQWVKNLFVAAPLIFARRLNDLPQAGRAAAALGLFCALSSAVYLWNDLVDIEKDRAHPKKRDRPIPSGRLAISTARWAAVVLSVGALLGAVFLSLNFAFVAAGYLLLNVAYSLKLKRIVYIDVLSIAAGFLLRVVGGGLAIAVWVSPYLLICTGLLATFAGFGKRAHELAVAGHNASKQRAVLQSYDPQILRGALWVTGLATVAAYVVYTLSKHTADFFHTTRMVWTVPFAAFALLRFAQIVSREDSHDSPTDAMLKDPAFLANLVIYGSMVIGVIYLFPG